MPPKPTPHLTYQLAPMLIHELSLRRAKDHIQYLYPVERQALIDALDKAAARLGAIRAHTEAQMNAPTIHREED